ncbi:MAG: GNAT family N-acetyltransferase [Burkholderiaceae bacterium]|nr:GNAT family N-acetyltransferase [Burkholderiaceae bacterium]
MTTSIRIATHEDADAACRVVHRSISECCAADHHNDPALVQAWLHNKTPENVRTWLGQQDAFSVVAEAEGVVVGFAMSLRNEVMLCYVIPEVRFTGAGKSMLHAIEAHAKVAGLTSLRLESTRTAQAFYGRNGFSLSGPAIVAFGMEGQPMAKTIAAH